MFQGWDNVFMLLGTASGSLIGLLFVVVTLTGGQDRARTLRAGGIYLTPNIGHFSVVLAIGAAAIAPRLPTAVTAVVMAAAALFGFINAVRTCLGILEFRRSDNPPHWSDIWMYGGTPGLLYLVLIAVAGSIWAGWSHAAAALAATLLALMLVAIRNAWDLISWMAATRAGPPGP